MDLWTQPVGLWTKIHNRNYICTNRIVLFWYSLMGLEQLIANVRWTFACRRLDGGNTLISAPLGQKCHKSRQRHNCYC